MENTQDVVELHRKIDDLQSFLHHLDSGKIADWEALLNRLERSQSRFECPKCKTTYKPHSFSQLKPADAIVACLREIDRPVGVGFLRRKLEEKGYPMRRFGRRYSYYYTIICRLADGENPKIKRLEGDEIMPAG